MKKLFIVICAVMMIFSLSAQNSGTFYMSLGNAYTPLGEFVSGGSPLALFSNSSGLSFGNEWITGITLDGDDDDDNGNDYWDNDQKDKLNNFNISGQFGYFVIDGLLTGLGVEYGSFSHIEEYEENWDEDGLNDEVTYRLNASSFALSPFIKYYMDVGNNALFFNTSYTFGSINFKDEFEVDNTSSPDYENDDEGEPYKTSRIEFGTGMAFFLTNNISLEPSVNFALNKYTQEREIYIGNTGMPYNNNIYDDQDYQVSTNAFYFKIAVTMAF